MRMARINVYLPDELARQARDADLNVSSLTQAALRSALAARRTNQWLDSLESLPRLRVSRRAAIAAVHEAREELGSMDD